MRSGNLIKASTLGSRQAGATAGPAPTKPGQRSPTARDEHDHEPEIRLHREGDDIIAIEVVCGCGRTTFIECKYPE